MPTVLTPINVPASESPPGVAVTFTAGDTGGNTFPLTGREVVVIRNVHATLARTVTVTSVADDMGRTKDITAHSIPAVTYHVLPHFRVNGWRDSSGNLTLTPSTTDIQFAVLRLPAGAA